MDEILLQSGFITADNIIFTRRELCDLGQEVTITINTNQITLTINDSKKNKEITNTFNTEEEAMKFLLLHGIIGQY
jgi:hypothetical protein